MEKWVVIPIFFWLVMELIEKVREFVSNILRDKEIEIVDITYRREGPGNVLRLILDKKGGITVDECGQVNEQLGELLDKENVITEHYTLEVSSPGLDRPLKTRKDFERVTGELVKVHTYGPVEEKTEHIGKVISCDEEFITLGIKDTAVIRKIPLGKIAKAQLEIEF